MLHLASKHFNPRRVLRDRGRRGSAFSRSGAAAVEAALMLPLLVLTTFGAIDVAQYINAAQVVSNASREGARLAVRDTTTDTDDVEAAVWDYLGDAFPQLSDSEIRDAVSVDVESPDEDSSSIPSGNLSTIESGEKLKVIVAFDFSTVRWLPGPNYYSLDTFTYCRRE